MKYPVVDLHNDLLSYLSHKEGRTPFEDQSRSSITQMKSGGMCQQILVIWTITGPDSVKVAEKQLKSWRALDQTIFSLAIENASAFALEDEPVEMALKRAENMLPLSYISLTWDGENRFGGGNGSSAGLKDDGKTLLRWMSGKKIAVDLSHTSDRLAAEILDCIDRENLKIPVLASHSNSREVQNKIRNLPKEIALEIIRRKGLIGLNFFAPFIGEKGLYAHIEYALKLGGEGVLAFGADFFSPEDFPILKSKYPGETFFTEELGNSACYPALLNEIERMGLMNPLKIASQNYLDFIVF